MPGPLAARWTLRDLPPVRAGTLLHAQVDVENAGTATWRPGGVKAASHWLDDRGNPIVWDGPRTELPHAIGPGERVALTMALRGPIPPGRYRLSLDLVDEHRLWVAAAAQEEALVPEDEAEAIAVLGEGVAPPPDWSRRVLDAHQEGYAVVGGSVDWQGGLLRRRPRELAPYEPGQGRVPGFRHPLVAYSHVRGLTPDMAEPVAGLAAARPPEDEPALFDGRIVVVLRR